MLGSKMPVRRIYFLVGTCFLMSHFMYAQVQEDYREDTFCFWTKLTSDGYTHHTFLRRTQERNEASLVLYHTVWVKNLLVNCVKCDEAAVTESYISKCKSAVGFSDSSDKLFNITQVLGNRSMCAMPFKPGTKTLLRHRRDLQNGQSVLPTHQNSSVATRPKSRRVKRAWMVPGTLWCGSGNQAENFTELGVFSQTDECCREHDHCEHTITSFSLEYGIFNHKLFTLSHCDCDDRFRQCLSSSNDGMANFVGFGYFNVLKMQCFEFSYKMQCAERSWWGTCITSELTQYAVVQDAEEYNFTHTASAEIQGEPSSNVAACKWNPKDPLKGLTPASTPVLSESNSDKRTINITVTGGLESAPPSKLEICAVFKSLDRCRFQIPGLQEKFGLHNTEYKTMYHCNCTMRSQQLSPVTLDDIHFLLMDFVSETCFTLSRPAQTPVGNSKVPFLQRTGSNRRHHLLTIKRLSSRRAKRKDTPVRLYKKCLRMHSKLQ
uniref:Phospholipase A2-like central domain-containing protein n=1 Tax=Denticeps clupeoides TaxID=299321 RepID=A0AAY4D287_9TELE